MRQVELLTPKCSICRRPTDKCRCAVDIQELLHRGQPGRSHGIVSILLVVGALAAIAFMLAFAVVADDRYGTPDTGATFQVLEGLR